MAQKEPETGPSLELPSLFGRRKRRAAPPVEEPPNDSAADAAGDTTTIPRTDAPSEPEQDATEVIPAVDPGPAADPAPAEADPAPAPASAHTPAVTPTPVPEPSPAPGPEPTHARTAETTPVPPPAPRSAPERAATAGATPARAAGGGRRRAAGTSRSLPEIAASTAAFLVGAVVGLAGCVLTYLGLQGCEAVTGTSSCGGPGLLVLVVILVVMVLLGAAILKALRVPEAGNISFLGVGILTVVALVFLASYLYDPWMFVVVPAVTAVSYALARWVTTLYAEDVLYDDDGVPHHDVR